MKQATWAWTEVLQNMYFFVSTNLSSQNPPLQVLDSPQKVQTQIIHNLHKESSLPSYLFRIGSSQWSNTIYHLNERFIAEAAFNKLVLCDAAIVVGVQGVKDLSEKGESTTHLHIDAQPPAPFDQVIKKDKKTCSSWPGHKKKIKKPAPLHRVKLFAIASRLLDFGCNFLQGHHLASKGLTAVS